MLKSELVEIISHHHPHLSREDSAKSVELILELMTETLSEGGRIEIRGFGSFSVRYAAPRNAHNPKTGEKVKTEGRYKIHFKSGKEMRERINKEKNP